MIRLTWFNSASVPPCVHSIKFAQNYKQKAYQTNTTCRYWADQRFGHFCIVRLANMASKSIFVCGLNCNNRSILQLSAVRSVLHWIDPRTSHVWLQIQLYFRLWPDCNNRSILQLSAVSSVLHWIDPQASHVRLQNQQYFRLWAQL